MIRLTGEITYAATPDQPESVEILQGEFASWELYALRSGIPPNTPDGAATPILMLQFLGYAAVHRGKPRAEWTDFEEWRGRVLSVDIEGDVDPAEAGTAVFPQVRSAG